MKKRESHLLRSVSIVSLMTAVSRVLGLVREVAMAYFFGTSALKSAFDIAFIIPNLFRRLFGEGALASAFIPIFSETLVKEGRAPARLLAQRVITLLVLALGIMTLGGILLTYPLEYLLPATSRWLLPLPMLRIMLPYALLICIAALVSGMLNALSRFAIPSLTPFLLNAIWLLALLIFCPLFRDLPERQIMALSWAILCAGAAQILFQLPTLARQGFHLKLTFSGLRDDPRLRRILVLMAPAALGIGIIQINVCLDKLLAFYADPAAPGALEYAERLVYLPLGMFGTAFMTVLLPTFSRLASQSQTAMMRETLERALRHLSIIMAPAAAALFTLALPLITLIYQLKGGRFDDSSALMSARALAAYAPGLLVFSLQKIQTPLFYGMQDLKTPVRVSMIGLVLNLTLNIGSVILLPAGWKHVGIAASTVATSFVNALILALILRHRAIFPRIRPLAGSLLRSCGSALVMALAAARLHPLLLKLLSEHGQSGKSGEIIAMGCTILASMVCYLFLLTLLSRQELREMIGEFRGRAHT